MYGDSTGLESADASSTDDPERCLREALRIFQACAAEAALIGEHKLQREAEDAAARCKGQLEAVIRSFEERERGRQAVHGQNPQDAEVT